MRRSDQLFPLTLLVAAAVASALFLSGCATLFSGTSQDVRIESTPADASVAVEGRERGTTPITVEVKRPEKGDPPEITIDKEGYQEQTLMLDKKFNMVTLLNVINPFNYALGVPVLGFGIDWYTGALWKYPPEEYTVELTSGRASSMAPPPSETPRYRLTDLPTNEQGHPVVPDHDEAVSIYDAETGTVYTFR